MKKRVYIGFLLICTLIFTACSGKEIQNGGNEDSINKEQAKAEATVEADNEDEGEKEEEKKNSWQKGELEMLSRSYQERSCNNEEGYYYITEESKELKGCFGYHLMYMDFATKQEVYLCNRAGCKHNTTECNAVLDYEEFGDSSKLFLYDGYLYLLSKEYDQDGVLSIDMMGDSGAMEQEKRQSALYRMNMDGTDRKKVFTFDKNVDIEDTVLADEEGIYFVTKKLKTDTSKNGTYYSSSDRKLVKLSPDSWKLEEIQKLSFPDDADGENWEIKGVYDDNLVVEKYHYLKAQTVKDRMEEADDPESVKEKLEQIRRQFAVINLSDGSLRSVYEAKAEPMCSSLVKGKYLYIAIEGKNNVRRIDLKSGKNILFTKLKNNSLWNLYQDVISCNSYDLVKDASIYFISLEDGKVYHSNLVEKSKKGLLEIVAETKDSFLVIYNLKTKDTGNGDGSYEVEQYQYGLIKKEDMYQGKDKFEPIQMTGLGR